MALSIYPWDIVTEMERRIENPQAMLLIVPNGKVKPLNALPFCPADLRHRLARASVGSLSRSLALYRKYGVRCWLSRRFEPATGHANETCCAYRHNSLIVRKSRLGTSSGERCRKLVSATRTLRRTARR